MKRTIALLLVLALAFGLTACGKEDKDISGKVTPATEAAPAITEPAPETTEAPAEDRPVSLGRMEGGVYTNEYIGIGCTLDANWTFKTAEELQELPAQTGFENVTMEKVTINYLGEERVAVRTTADFYDVPLYMLQVFEHNLGKYYAVITFTSVMEDTTQSMADLFYAID